MRDFYEGWKPKKIKVEEPTPEQSAKFLNFVKKLRPWATQFWLIRLGIPHKRRVANAYKQCLNEISEDRVDSPYHMTAMLTEDERRAFKILHLYNADKDILFYAAAILCLRERFMFASTILDSITGTS